MHLDEDYQELTRQLESVEGSIPAVGLVEETEDKLIERIKLFQVLCSYFILKSLMEEDLCHDSSWSPVGRTVGMDRIRQDFGDLQGWRSHSRAENLLQCCTTFY